MNLPYSSIKINFNDDMSKTYLNIDKAFSFLTVYSTQKIDLFLDLSFFVLNKTRGALKSFLLTSSCEYT